MTTVLDAAPTMTHKEAEAAITDWQTKLDAARATLAETESNIGKVALAEGVDKATERVTRLQVEVKMAEAGVAAATAQRNEARRCEHQAHIAQLRADAAELERQVEEHAAFYTEWQPKVELAYNQLTGKSQRALQKQRQADEWERRLNEGMSA